MVRCKACGFIMEEGKLGDRCPACGAARTAFEPYKDPVAMPRRRILDLQLHPIAVHFPTVLAVATFVFSLGVYFLSGEVRALLLSSAKVLVLLVPLLVVVAFLMGWVDGRIRFRKIRNSQILKKKIVYAIVLFVVSSGLAADIWIGAFDSPAVTIVAVVLSGAAVVLVFLLGLLGTSIIGAIFPGK